MRSVIKDILADHSIFVSSDDLIKGLNELADRGQIERTLVNEATSIRALSIIPHNPPVTKQEAVDLYTLTLKFIGILYLNPQ